jgi:threonine aldolase
MPEMSNAMPPVDLRSDTVTKPTPAMLDRMVHAELGDDVWGDDPTVKQLEKLAGERLGKEAGLFLPSGTMSNQVAILTHARTKGEVIGEAASHIFRSELGGLSLIAGLYPRPLPGKRGAMDIDSLRSSLRPPEMTANALGTAVVCMETTHNAAGGSVLPLEHMREVYNLCVHRAVPVHLDGARIFNAALALGVAASEIAAHADSATFCLSKGLSAPVGSVLTGSADFIHRARGFRRMLGGNMRQVGLLAACGIVALEQSIDRLAEDHANARRLANGLHHIEPSLVDPNEVATNIVMVDVGKTRASARRWTDVLAGYGVLAAPATASVIRFVTHRHVSETDIDRAVAAFGDIYTTRPMALFAA